jgi:rubrerythrin
MTTYAELSVTCAVCGVVSKQTVLRSTNSFGSPDLDLRPPEMQRSTMNAWVQCCPSCGYCSTDLAEADAGTAETVRGDHYRQALADTGLPELARQFWCRSLLVERAGLGAAAADAAVWAAWECDDMRNEAGAARCRNRAIELLQRWLSDPSDAADAEKVETAGARLVDLLRRAGHFERAIAEARLLAAKTTNATIQHVAAFQERLCAAGDVKARTVREAMPGEPSEEARAAETHSKARASLDAAEARQKLEAQRMAALWQRIRDDGWTCTHCGATGLAEHDFRLSKGKVDAIICRSCAWPQALPAEA